MPYQVVKAGRQSRFKTVIHLNLFAKEGKQESYVYRAANRSVPEVAKELINEREPKQASKEDENQMFLVYSDKIYNLQKDKEKPSDTLIEISNKEFVRQNYQPSFCKDILWVAY